MAFLGGLAASILAPRLDNMLGGGGGGLLGGLFGGGGGGGTQSQNNQGNAPPPDYAPAPNQPQYDQTSLLMQQQANQAVADAKLATIQSQAQAVINQQQAQAQLDKMAITMQLHQQSAALKASQAQLEAEKKAKSSDGMIQMMPYLAVGAVLLVVLLK